MKTLRLLFSEKCNRDCALCCNKTQNLDSLPVCNDYASYEEIIITGGEPMLNPKGVLALIAEIREANPSAKIFMYTANCMDTRELAKVMDKLDGVTITLHEQQDVAWFERFTHGLGSYVMFYPEWAVKTFHLNVFKGIQHEMYPHWEMKTMEWLEDCPLPSNEVFMRCM